MIPVPQAGQQVLKVVAIAICQSSGDIYQGKDRRLVRYLWTRRMRGEGFF